MNEEEKQKLIVTTVLEYTKKVMNFGAELNNFPMKIVKPILVESESMIFTLQFLEKIGEITKQMEE